MTVIDDFIEKCEVQIDKIVKYQAPRSLIRGALFGMDPNPSAIELWPKKYAIHNYYELCTIGAKNFGYLVDDLGLSHNVKKAIPKDTAWWVGMIVGGFLTAYTYGAPWAAAGAVDLVNLYLKKREKKQNDPEGKIKKGSL